VLSVHEFSNSLSAANTAKALAPPSGYPSYAYDFVVIYNNNASDSIKVGDSSTQALTIPAAGSISIDVRTPNALNITSIYWVAPTSGDTIVVMYA
jgi:hypothetical protein